MKSRACFDSLRMLSNQCECLLNDTDFLLSLMLSLVVGALHYLSLVSSIAQKLLTDRQIGFDLSLCSNGNYLTHIFNRVTLSFCLLFKRPLFVTRSAASLSLTSTTS